MSSITAQQAKLDLELVPKEKRLKIWKCNRRLNPRMIQREPTFQVVLDALALTLCYSAFLITADVPEVYMHQLWDSVYKHDNFYKFKLDKRKRFKLTLEVFRDIFKICPRVQGQDFDALSTDAEIMPFLRDLGHTREIHSLNDVVFYQMHQPWRNFAALINRSLSGKTFGLDKLCLSRAQILWGMYHQKNVGYVELFWEDFIYQIDNKAYKKQEKMYYPRFTKVIIHYFLTQDKTLSWRNKIGMHTSRDDYLIDTLRFVSAKEETQIYGAILLESLTSPEMKGTKAYKTYLGKDVDATRGKGIELLSEVALAKDTQFEEVRRKSMRDFHKTHPSGSGTITKTAPNAKIKLSITNERTGVKLGVPDVTEDDSSESKAESWGNDEDDNNNDHDSRSEGSDQERDSGDDKAQSDSEKGLDSEHETYENESDSESDQDKNEEDIEDDEDEVKDEFVKTLSNDSEDEDETKITDKAEGDEDEEMDYTTRNKNPEILQVIEDAHVTLSTVLQKTEVPITNSSHSFDLAAKFLNFLDILRIEAQIVSLMDVHVHHEVPSKQTPTLLIVPVLVISDSSLVYSTVIPQSLPSFTPPPQKSTPTSPPTTEAINPQSALPNFASVFQFNNRATTLEKEVVELKKDLLHTQVTALVDDHLDARLGATREEFMNRLSSSITARVIEQVKI
ncbi:hypothetical protein Tco_1428309 [Tanacetum coccineum]